jgi:hypothetical protein
MEDILDLYAEPYKPRYPVVCCDESPYQLVSEVRQPLPNSQAWQLAEDGGNGMRRVVDPKPGPASAEPSGGAPQHCRLGNPSECGTDQGQLAVYRPEGPAHTEAAISIIILVVDY